MGQGLVELQMHKRIRSESASGAGSFCGQCLKWSGLALLCVLATGCTELVRPNFRQAVTELRPGEYSVDPDHVYLLFRIGHLGLSTVVGRFNSVDATLDFNPEDLGAMRLDGVIDMASVDLGNADLEKRLRGADWLDIAHYPEASFVTTNVLQVEGNRIRINGNFTLHGVTQPLVLDATFNGGADNLLTGKYTLGFSAFSEIRRSDFGIDSLAALVADVIVVEIHAEFQRK